MSPELIAIIAAAVSLGGLVAVQIAGVRASITGQIAGVRASIEGLDVRLRAVETELAYLRGLLQGAGVGPRRQPDPPAADEGAAA